ncbi:MAG TPA: thymidine phosphorylase [Candidatus Nanoarchaeia archaeon]|nr:thymidine phosphorylase [Candidatus Nanoarchaeia archaeon]
MKLKVKFLKWHAGLPVAMLNHRTADKLGVQIQGNISIKTLSKHPREMSTIIDTIDKPYAKENEILVSSEIKKEMRLENGEKVDVNLAQIPESLSFIKKKLNNKRLSKKEIFTIVKDISKNSLTEPEIALFVAAMYKQGMSINETIDLIEAMIKCGNEFVVRGKYVVDKHSIGGVAGNRTTPVVVSICAAAGMIFPKTSSRAITSAAGTADVIEAIAKVEFTPKELKKILKKTNAFIVWGGSLDMVPVDTKIIKVERDLNIDPKSQLIASIMSKKFAIGSKYILIDIPYGKTVKVNKKKAEELKKEFLKLGKHFHKKIKCVLTDGSQPIGNGIGPVLELVDITKILNPKEKGPRDLEKKSVFLAGQIFEMVGKAKKGEGEKMAEQFLSSGKAFKKFKEIIKAQGGSLNKLKKRAKFVNDIKSSKTLTIAEIDNKKINQLARITGCPVDKFSGIYLHNHVGERVERGKKIITIYSETASRLNQAIKFYHSEKPIKFR